jgi:predicted Zn finger-like uncharacterized protein
LRVSCERCATEYDFDPTLIAKGGTRVRCTSCGHTFRVVAPESETAIWVVRTQDGELYEVASIGELKARIASRELSTDDEIRRGDEAWKGLGEIVELRPHFEAARGLSSARVPVSEPPKLAPVEGHKATLLGVGLAQQEAPPPLGGGRMTLPELVAPPVPPARTTMRQGPSIPPALPSTPVTPRDEPVRGTATTLLPHEEPVRGSATTILPEQGPVRGSATTLLPGQLSSYEAPTTSPQSSRPPASSAASAGGSSKAWHEEPSPDEPFVYRPSEPLIAPLPPLRLESERPRRAAKAGRRSGPRLGVLLPVLLGLGFGIGYGLRHRLPDPLRGVFASIHHTLFGHDEGAAHEPPPVPSEPEAQAAEAPAHDPSTSPIVEVPAEDLLDAPEPEAGPEPEPRGQPAEEVAPQPTLDPAEVEDLSYDALIRRGERSLERGRTSAARKDFERALELRPGAPEALTGLGYIALDAGSLGSAAEKFRTAAKASYADAYIGLGEAYRKLGRTEDALAAYERYLERWPSGSSASVARNQASALRASLSRARPSRSDESEE